MWEGLYDGIPLCCWLYRSTIYELGYVLGFDHGVDVVLEMAFLFKLALRRSLCLVFGTCSITEQGTMFERQGLRLSLRMVLHTESG